MRKYLLLLLVVGLFARADMLDIRNYTIVVSSSGGGMVGSEQSEQLKERALGLLRQASYDRDIPVSAFLATHPKNGSRLERMTMSPLRSETKFRSDGAMTVEHEFSMLGSVMEQLLPVTGDGALLGPVACPCCGQEWPEGRDVPSDMRLVPLEEGEIQVYTGILVDARGLDYEFALIPRVVTEEDEEVYGPGFVDEEHLAERGMVGYYGDRTEALVSERIGPNPLVVHALTVTGSNWCDLVVSGYDAARIHASAANLELLSECRVGFLVE